MVLTGIYLASMVLLYIGERLVLESTGLRIGLAVVALGGMLGAIVLRLRRLKTLGEQARPVERRILLLYLVGVAALLIYALQADFVMDKLRPAFSDSKAVARWEGSWAALWPVVWLCSVLPLIFVELSYATMDVRRTVEERRTRRSRDSALLLAMSVALVFVLNFIVSEYNEKWDLAYFRTTQPSDASKEMVRSLARPLKVVLFFPGANDVQEEATSFFEGLEGLSPHFKLQVADHVLEPELAKELSVSSNGVVVLARDKQNEKIRLGTELAQAKRKLAKLDQEFQSAFLKVNRAKKNVYFTVGHEERSAKARDETKGSSIRDLRTLFTQLNYFVKELGIGQGLASEVPADASLVVIAGPTKPFVPEEVNALRKYLENGGSALVMLDPEAGWDAAGLLGPFGIQFTPQNLANDRYHARVSNTQADRYNLFSIRFASHESVMTLSRNSPKLATVFFGAGSLAEIPSTAKLDPKVKFTIHSMPMTWNDINLNHAFDADGEKRKVYELMASVTLKANPGKGNKAKNNEMRLVVIGDSDVATDKVLRHPGNGYLFVDIIKWLGGEEKFIGEPTSEEDVRIVHTREEDQLWFYLTIFAVPGLVLGGGLLYTRRRRRK
jgi:ABC-type uncharacterized transport system involved in gliding motility auxiliary subunit